MKTTLAFDVYGTLIDTKGVYNLLEKMVGNQASSFMNIWRTKQLEYSFRRGLMKNHVNFSVCTENALDFTSNQLNCNLSPEEKRKLMKEYNLLPAFPDVSESLARLKSDKFRLFAFSNGRSEDVGSVLKNAGIIHFFEGIVSVDDIKSFKPDPAVYIYFMSKAGSSKNDTWLISGNPFDVIGAISTGMQSVWLRRSSSLIFDPWEIEPTEVISNMSDLYQVLQR